MTHINESHSSLLLTDLVSHAVVVVGIVQVNLREFDILAFEISTQLRQLTRADIRIAMFLNPIEQRIRQNGLLRQPHRRGNHGGKETNETDGGEDGIGSETAVAAL